MDSFPYFELNDDENEVLLDVGELKVNLSLEDGVWLMVTVLSQNTVSLKAFKEVMGNLWSS